MVISFSLLRAAVLQCDVCEILCPETWTSSAFWSREKKKMVNDKMFHKFCESVKITKMSCFIKGWKISIIMERQEKKKMGCGRWHTKKQYGQIRVGYKRMVLQSMLLKV